MREASAGRDRGEAVVTAIVSEAVYNCLPIGSPVYRPPSASLSRFVFAEPNAGASSVGIDELDACFLKRTAD
jgi:hypothetical protein